MRGNHKTREIAAFIAFLSWYLLSVLYWLVYCNGRSHFFHFRMFWKGELQKRKRKKKTYPGTHPIYVGWLLIVTGPEKEKGKKNRILLRSMSRPFFFCYPSPLFLYPVCPSDFPFPKVDQISESDDWQRVNVPLWNSTGDLPRNVHSTKWVCITIFLSSPSS